MSLSFKSCKFRATANKVGFEPFTVGWVALGNSSVSGFSQVGFFEESPSHLK
jgi:hypothetical protein